jgi:hypothetical protein
VTPGATGTQLGWAPQNARPSITLTYTAAPTPPSPPPIVPPIVSSVTPTSGSTSGGSVVTIAGSYFGSARQVYFGVFAAPRFSIGGFSQITAVGPAGAAGTVNVRVVGAQGFPSALTPNDYFTYVAPGPAPPAPPTPTPSPPTPTPPTPAPKTCTVPALHNRSLSTAKRLLARANCSLGTVVYQGSTRGALVYRQSIPRGTLLVPGDKVGLRLRAPHRGRHR